MENELRRSVKGQMIVLMQAGHPGKKQLRWQASGLVDQRLTNCCAMFVCGDGRSAWKTLGILGSSSHWTYAMNDLFNPLHKPLALRHFR
jgi:hypothetical protein